MAKMPLINEEIAALFNKKDKILPFTSEKWPIYELNLKLKKGLWDNFSKKLKELKEKNILEQLDDEIINEFYYRNPDIEFETIFNDDVFSKNYLFKIDNKVYAYGIGKKSKRSKNIYYVRFYFNLVEFFKFN